MTKDQAKKVVEGILNGAVGATDFSDLDKCISDFQFEAENFEKAYADLK